MKLPNIFKQDIQSNNVQLIPLLIIERDAHWSDWVYNSTSIFLSTHDIHIPVTETGVPEGELQDGIYFSPLLLDNPIITEKIDIQNRKYTISKCTFKISNNHYNGVRFSDTLNSDNLIGRKVNFAYKSINSSLPVGSMYFDATANNTWGDLYDSYEYISPTFYFGEIRDVKHDNETVTITAEDLSSSLLHQDVPRNKIPAKESIPEHYRGASIPMVYGYMPKSPLVMGYNKKIYADSRPFQEWFTNNVNEPGRYGYPFDSSDYSPLFIAVDDNMCNILNNIEFPLTETQKITNWEGYSPNPEQVIYEDDDGIYGVSVAKLTTNPLLSRSMLQVLSVYKPSKISLEERNFDPVWNPESVSGTSLGDSSSDWDPDFLLDNEFDEMTDGNYSPNDDIAEGDTPEYARSEAMTQNEGDWDQLERNFYKHSLFRFVIDVEPPIEFVNRGGIGEGDQQYYHWVAFGHWVMPDQSSKDFNGSHNIYTYARDNDDDDSSERIRRRWTPNYTSPDEQGNFEEDGTFDVRVYKAVSPFQSSNPESDAWGNEIQLGDIVRFSDFHDDETFSSINPEQINWNTYGGGKSPLEFYNTGFVNESGDADYNKEYSNPYAKFTNGSDYGWYEVQLGNYGWQGSETITSETSSNYQVAPNVNYNFDYTGEIKGWLPEVTCMSVCDIKTNFHDMYGSVVGRINDGEDLILHPSDIIADIFVKELGHNADKIDQTSLDATKTTYAYDDAQFSFTQAEQINSKDLIEDIARSTLIFPRIGFDGLLKFPQIKSRYDQTDLDNSILIQDSDIISYSYDLTKREELITATHLKYDYDHQNDNYFGDKDTKTYSGSNITGTIEVTDEEALYHGIKDKSTHVKEFESKYLRSDDYISLGANTSDFVNTIRKFQNMNTNHYRNRHLIIKCKLPIRYLDIEVGDYIRFNKLIDGIKAHGIDYTKLEAINNQYIYPLFLCTSMKKSIEYIELECLQLHHLWFISDPGGASTPLAIWNDIGEEQIPSIYYDGNVVSTEEEEEEEPEIIYGCTDAGASNYNPDATVDDGTCEYAPPQDYGSIAFDEELSVNSEYISFYPYVPASFALDSFDLDVGAEYPYSYGTPNQLFFQSAISEFGDPDSGIHIFCPPNRIYISDQYGANQISNFNELAPPEWSETTAENMHYVALDINFARSTAEDSDDNFNFTFRLKNTQTEIGQPIQMDWILIVNDGDASFSENGDIVASPYFGDPHGSSQVFTLINYTEFDLIYWCPHFMFYPYPEIDQQSLLTGDINNDGRLNVIDVVLLVNHITADLPYEDMEAGDINQDENLDVLDVVVAVSIILGTN